MFYNQYREVFENTFSFFFFCFGGEGNSSYSGEGNVYKKGQMEGRGRKTSMINNDLLILKPHTIVISSVKV